MTLPPVTLREDEWARWVIDVALLHGWQVQHVRPGRTAKGWRTPIQGHVGAPDLLLARAGDVLCAELKTRRGRVRPEQQLWLDQLGPHGCVWRPADADHVLARLTRGDRP